MRTAVFDPPLGAASPPKLSSLAMVSVVPSGAKWSQRKPSTPPRNNCQGKHWHTLQTDSACATKVGLSRLNFY